MKKRIFVIVLVALIFFATFPFFSVSTQAANVSLSSDEQWIIGLNTNYEYITETTFIAQNANAANNPYWTKISGGYRKDGSRYSSFRLVEGNKLQVASAWYGQDVYFRVVGSTGKGTVIQIPEYSQLKEPYKKSIKVFNAFSADTGNSFYGHYIDSISNNNGYLNNTSQTINIEVSKSTIEIFNRNAKIMLTDAEGNYIYDLVAIGAYTNDEPDISGAAAWALKEYINEGYGFLIGHDTMYGYGGVTDEKYVPDKSSTVTPMYELNTNNNGHWNLNWLMGVNKKYTDASPYEAASMILNLGDWKDKRTLYGDDIKGNGGISELNIVAVTSGNPETNISARCPTNYPYNNRTDGVALSAGITAGATHTNQQLAYGKVWINFKSNTTGGILVADKNAGLTGTNNFYLTTNGNFGMMQIGHSKDNLVSAQINEARILANTILYLSQRQPCEVCQSQQNGNAIVHAVTRISLPQELAKIGDTNYWYTYPLNGCYVLSQDLILPDNWTPIENFNGHFNTDNHNITISDKPVFKQSGILGLNENGWNLGTNLAKGLNRIANGKQNITGIARVVGHLNRLFGTDNTVDYSNYKIIITDADGKSYDGITNREGKYVISNLPCTGTALSASVYTPSGKEITEYGEIYAKISTDAWDNNETVPLQLKNQTVQSIPNQMVLEDENAIFTAAINTNILPEKITWQYRGSAGDTWKNVSSSTMFEAVATPITIVTTPESTLAQSTLTVLNAQLLHDNLQFRAVFVLNGISFVTSDANVTGAAGMLNVRQRPFRLSALSDISVWQGETITLPAQLTYYKPIDQGVTVRWQYRGAPNCTWENVYGSNIVKEAMVHNSYDNSNGAPTADIGYISRSNLVITNASTDINGYEFRAIFEDTVKSRVFTTDSVATTNKTGKVTVTPRLLSCITQPVNIVAQTSGDTAFGQYRYTAEFEYSAPNSDIQLSWEYKQHATDSYKSISVFPFSGIASASTSTPVLIRPNTYRIKATLTLNNPPTVLDTGNNHYYFRAKSVAGTTVYSGSADISFNYKIDIKPGTPIVRISSDGLRKTYTYPNLTVFAPEGVRNMKVTFDKNSMQANAIMQSKQILGGITEIAGQKGFVYNSDTPLSAKQMRDYLRQLEIVLSTQDVNMEWFISSERMPGNFEPLTGKYYDFVRDVGVTWTQSFERARWHYNSALQAQGQLATIRNDVQNEFVRKQLGSSPAWIGATNDRGYLPLENWGQYLWIDGSALSYDRLTSKPSGNNYAQMQPSGAWLAVRNTQSTIVTVTDLINYSAGNLGGWSVESGIFHGAAAEGTNNNQGYTGLMLLAPASTWGVDTVVAHSVYLKNGHQYWVYGMIGEYGDSNGNMILSTPFAEIRSYWDTGSATINGVYTWYGATGWQTVRARTNGNGPNHTGVGGQLYHLEIVNLTEGFTQNGAETPTAQWLTDNIGVFNGSRTINYTSNSSQAQGYVVEYLVNDNLPAHTAKTAKATAYLQGLRPGDKPPAIIRQAKYRTGTEVLISCGVMGITAINPENSAKVTFKITAPDGTILTKNYTDICVPAGSSQRAYVSYLVPDIVGALSVDITTSDNLQADTIKINANIVRIQDNPPPDPKARDRNDNFIMSNVPSFSNATQHIWQTYTCVKTADDWSYTEHENAVTLQSVLQTQPDAQVPTAIGKTLRSGYGINAYVTARVSGSGISNVIAPQTVIAYFPEFQYQSYWRLLEPAQRTTSSSMFHLRDNPYSMVNARSHFLPVWYPDSDYKTVVTIRDIWTPVGELMQAVNDTLQIDGSVYDDWYISNK